LASLPESLGGYIPGVVTRSEEVWIDAGFDTKKVFRYHTDSRRWQTYNSIDGIAAMPEALFVSRDGTLWGIGVDTFGPEFAPRLPLLSRYDEKNDRFEFIIDVDGILVGIGLLRNLLPISEDQTGLLWFFGSRYGDDGLGDDSVGLYSFDPATLKAEKRISLPRGYPYTGPVAGPDGMIWYYNGSGERGKLFTYSPITREVQPYYGIPSFERIGSPISLFFDQDGRLWADNKGWLYFADPENPIWYEIIPSTAFLTDQGAFRTDDVEGPRSRYGFTPPIHISQSSNGWMWFTTLDGTIRLDLENEEWCLFTTGSSPVVEDDEGNVWISVFDKLYKYQLEP
jgi:streptogramin lyase